MMGRSRAWLLLAAMLAAIYLAVSAAWPKPEPAVGPDRLVINVTAYGTVTTTVVPLR